MPHSLHSILKDVLDSTNGAITIRFSGGGATSAHSVHSIARAVYDKTNGAIHVTAPTFTGSGTTGIVPDPGSETGKYLKDDGTWDTPAGGGSGGGNTVSVYEDSVLIVDSSVSDMIVNFDGADFALVEDTGDNEVIISVDDSGIDHDALTNTHNLTTDIDHDSLTNTHNLTTDIDHDAITNTHNLTTDIDHDALTNFVGDEHLDWTGDQGAKNIHANNITEGSVTQHEGAIDHDNLTNTHNLTTDIDHDSLTNTHNLTTDIDHDSLTNTHNLTTDIDHDQLTNFAANEHFTEASIDHTAIQNIGTNSHATIDSKLHDRSHAITGTSDHTANNWKVFYSDGSGDVQELALGSNGEYLMSNGAAAAPSFETPSVNIDLSPYVVTDTTGNTDISGISPGTIITMDDEKLSNANYTLESTGVVTVGSAGIYEIFYAICWDITDTSGATRSCVEGWLQRDQGSGTWIAIPGSYGRGYVREASGGSGTSGHVYVELATDESVRVMGLQIYGGGSVKIDTSRGGSTLQFALVG